jgi:integrase
MPGNCRKCGEKMRYLDNWYISFTAGGKEILQAVSPNRRLAEAVLAKKKTEVREGKFFQTAKDYTWDEGVKKFRTWFLANTSINTQRMYENCLKMLEPHFGEYTLRQITAEMVENYKMLRSESVTNSTINRDIATIKRLYSLMSDEWKLLNYNPVRSVAKLSENPSRIRFLTHDEETALLAACESSSSRWLRLGVMIALNTGLRKETITSLMFSEIDFQARFIRAKTKGGKSTNVPMNDIIYKELWEYCEEQKSRKIVSPYLFPSQTSSMKPIRADIHDSFDRACKKAGIENFRFHDLRHTFARKFYKRTHDWKALSQILNHSDVSVTMRI